MKYFIYTYIRECINSLLLKKYNIFSKEAKYSLKTINHLRGGKRYHFYDNECCNKELCENQKMYDEDFCEEC